MTLVIALQLLTLAAVATYVVYCARFSIDLERVAGAIAASLLETYAAEIETLEPEGTKRHARTRYLELCAFAGLPERAADWVAGRVWEYVAKAQGTEPAQVNRKEFSFYDE